MKIHLIAAVSENGVIGKKGELPWHIPEDLKRFKKLTMGHVVLMGRKTWESIPEKYRPLPGRTNVVVTRKDDFTLPENVERYASIDDALETHKNKDIYVIGGGEIYRQTIDRADRIYLTRVHKEIDGDVFFPEMKPNDWTEIDREDHDEFSFLTYERKW